MQKLKTKSKMKNLILMINTTAENEITIFLFDGYKTVKDAACGQKDKLLSFIDKVMQKNKKKIWNVGGIVIVSGPGSFTAVRQGAVVANTLGFALRIPVVGVRLDEFKDDNEFLKVGLEKLKRAKVGEIVFPFYGREPNITKSKQ